MVLLRIVCSLFTALLGYSVWLNRDDYGRNNRDTILWVVGGIWVIALLNVFAG